MIDADAVMPLLLEACPSFGPTWLESEVDNFYDETGERLYYIDACDFVRHIIKLIESQQTEELPAIFDVIERLHLEGDEYVKELATIGYLEDLQNTNFWQQYQPQKVRALLGPESLRWWNGVQAFWEGKSKAVIPLDEEA